MRVTITGADGAVVSSGEPGGGMSALLNAGLPVVTMAGCGGYRDANALLVVYAHVQALAWARPRRSRHQDNGDLGETGGSRPDRDQANRMATR